MAVTAMMDDIELTSINSRRGSSADFSLLDRWRRLRSLYKAFQRLLSHLTSSKENFQVPIQSIEDYPQGYPRFAALVGSHSSFHICRRFSTVRARILLLKQDRVVQLEEQLNAIDRNEPRPLVLGNARRDKSAERAKILAELETALMEYDAHVKRIRQCMRASEATSHGIDSLRNWITGTAAIARAETEYLARKHDLMVISDESSEDFSSLETRLVRMSIRMYTSFRNYSGFNISRDRHVRVYSGNAAAGVGRALIAWGTSSLILVPIVLLASTRGLANRLIVIVFATALFVTTLSYMTRTKTKDMFLAGATYAAILVVFVDANGNARYPT